MWNGLRDLRADYRLREGKRMAGSAKKILVAEDNNVLAHVLQINLELGGLNVTIAADGEEAIRQLSAEHFDLLITDYQMPKVDGAGLCRYIRDSATLRELPIILCSAKGLELDTAAMERDWQVRKVFYKPFSMREMLRCVRSILGQPAEPVDVPVIAGE
jgi:DNA-binding response OmpR family regulator